jgi:hypothetical protein
VSAGSSCEDRFIGQDEGHGWDLGRAHEGWKRGEDRLTKEDMRSAGVSEDRRRQENSSVQYNVATVLN